MLLVISPMCRKIGNESYFTYCSVTPPCWNQMGRRNTDTISSTKALVLSIAEYCATVGSKSAHTIKLDAVLSNTMYKVTGALHATQLNKARPALWPQAAVLALLHKARNDEDNLLHDIISEASPPARLKSCQAFMEPIHQLLTSTLSEISKQVWLKCWWKQKCEMKGHQRLHRFIDEPIKIQGSKVP